MRVLICGSRDWTDTGPAPRMPSDTVVPRRAHPPPGLGGDLIRRELSSLQGVDVVIEGEAPGADTLTRHAAEELGIPVLPFPADWDRHGRAAGPIRNQRMIDEGHPDLVLAFTQDLNSSRGTADMVARAKRAGLPLRLISHTGEKSL